MSDNSPLESASFFAVVGCGLGAVGIVAVSIGVSQTKIQVSDFSSGWFDGGLIALVLGGVAVIYAFALRVAYRHLARDRGRTTVVEQRDIPRRKHVIKPPGAMEPITEIEAGVTPAQLSALYDGVTGIQARRLIAPYIGKLMTYSGVIDDVDGRGDDAAVLVLDGGEVGAYFEGKAAERAILLMPGQSVTVRGVIDLVGRSGVNLHHCQFMDVGPAHSMPEAKDVP